MVKSAGMYKKPFYLNQLIHLLAIETLYIKKTTLKRSQCEKKMNSTHHFGKAEKQVKIPKLLV